MQLRLVAIGFDLTQCPSVHLAHGPLHSGLRSPENNPWDQYQDFGHSHWSNSLIYGYRVTNVTIRGGGLVSGDGQLSQGNSKDGDACKVGLSCHQSLPALVVCLSYCVLCLVVSYTRRMSQKCVRADTPRPGREIVHHCAESNATRSRDPRHLSHRG